MADKEKILVRLEDRVIAVKCCAYCGMLNATAHICNLALQERVGECFIIDMNSIPAFCPLRDKRYCFVLRPEENGNEP